MNFPSIFQSTKCPTNFKCNDTSFIRLHWYFSGKVADLLIDSLWLLLLLPPPLHSHHFLPYFLPVLSMVLSPSYFFSFFGSRSSLLLLTRSLTHSLLTSLVSGQTFFSKSEEEFEPHPPHRHRHPFGSSLCYRRNIPLVPFFRRKRQGNDEPITSTQVE